MPDTLAWQRLRLGDACQSGKVAALLKSFFSGLEFLFLPNYRANYYDMIIVKWCSGIACNWCVSLDIALMLALKPLAPKSPDSAARSSALHSQLGFTASRWLRLANAFSGGVIHRSK